jgi:hypothetical protein
MTYGDRHPQDATRERLAQVAELLATGLLRLRLKQAQASSALSARSGESSLDCPARRSVHADPQERGFAA